MAYPAELSLEADPGWVVRARFDRVEWRAALRVGVLQRRVALVDHTNSARSTTTGRVAGMGFGSGGSGSGSGMLVVEVIVMVVGVVW